MVVYTSGFDTTRHNGNEHWMNEGDPINMALPTA